MPVTRLVKLRLDNLTRRRLERWRFQLEGVWNWAVRACEREHLWYAVDSLAVAKQVAFTRWQTLAQQAVVDGTPLPNPIDWQTCRPRREVWLQQRLFTLLNGHAKSGLPVAVMRQTVHAVVRAFIQARKKEQNLWAERNGSSLRANTGAASPAATTSTGVTRIRVKRKGVRNRLEWLGADSVTVNLQTESLDFPGLRLSVAEARARGRTERGLRFFGHSSWPKTVTGEPAKVAKTVRLLWRPRGWYAALVFQETIPNLPPLRTDAAPILGADLGFSSVLTLSDGTTYTRDASEDRLLRQLPKVSRKMSVHPQHQATRTTPRQKAEDRQRQRTGPVATLQQRYTNAKQWRNRRIVRDIQSRTEHLILLQDRLSALQRIYGKSIFKNALGDLVTRLCVSVAPGSQTGTLRPEARGWQCDQLPGAYSTTTCPACQARTGPSGWAQVSIRVWTCGQCRSRHDRDTAAAQNAVVWWTQPRHRPTRGRAGPRPRQSSPSP